MSRIAIIVSGKSPTSMPGGLGSYSYNVARIFCGLGYDTHIIGYSKQSATKNFDFATLHEVSTQYDRLISFGAFLIMRQLIPIIEKLIHESNADEIVVYGAGIWGDVGGQLKKKNPELSISSIAAYFTTFKHEYAGQVTGVPFRDYGLFYPLSIRFMYFLTCLYHVPREHGMMRSVDKIIVHYDSTRKILIDEINGLDTEKIYKIPYFIDHYERGAKESVENSKSSHPLIVNVCRQDPRKDINTLLKALKILKDKGVKFQCILAGSGVLLEKNRAMAKKYQLTSHVKFPGFIKSSQELIEKADIFVFPSVEEGSGAISLLEAMKEAKPIITTRCDGIPEDIKNLENGLLVEPLDEIDLANKIELLLENKDLRSSLGLSAKETFLSKFSFTGMKNGIKNVLLSNA